MTLQRPASAFTPYEAPTLKGRPTLAKPSVVDPLVLVVDDDQDGRTIYVASLEHLGYPTIEGRDGSEAIDAARKYRPEVVLMDLAMPRLDGLEAARRIKADAASRDCFVILMTAYGGDAFVEATGAGCSAFLCKPFNPFVLEVILRELRLWERDEVVKRCGCGRSLTRSQWRALPLCGRIQHAELRNCGCDSSLALSRRDLARH